MNRLKEYEININILVIYETLKSLESSYYSYLPQRIKKHLQKFLKVLTEYLEEEDETLKKYDYEHIEYIKKIYYEMPICLQNGGK